MCSQEQDTCKTSWFQKCRLPSMCSGAVQATVPQRCSSSYEAQTLLMHHWGTSSMLPLCVRILPCTTIEASCALDLPGRHQNIGTAKGLGPYSGPGEMENDRSLCCIPALITCRIWLCQRGRKKKPHQTFGCFTATVKLLLLPPHLPFRKKKKALFNLPACKWLLNNTVVFGSIDQRALPMRTVTLCSLRLALFHRNWMLFCCCF